MNHQISIVGSQLLPIYVGIKEFNPDKVHFIVSNESIGSIAVLKPLLKNIQHSVHNCDAFDFFAIKATCEKIIDKIDSSDSITFNLTGGTKIMVLACQALIIEKGLNGFYINQDDTLLELPSYTRKKINTELDTKEFLDLSGHNISSSNVLSDFTADDFKMSAVIESFANSDRRYTVITNHFRKKYNNSNQKIPSAGKENLPNGIEVVWSINSVLIKANGKDLLSLKSKNILQLFFNSAWWELQIAKEMSNWSKLKELLINSVLPFKIDIKSAKNENPPDPPHRKDGLVLCQHTRQTLQSTLWYCSQFLTVIFFVAMLPKHLAHCLFRFAPQPKSQANTQHSNKKTLHSNHHHRSAYASIKTA
jgi:hypothetical protein